MVQPVSAGSLLATSRDLVRELEAVTPDSLRPLLRDLFEEVTVWDVRTGEARVEPAGAGAYRVTLDVHAARLRTDTAGNETAVPMDELVEVGVFGGSADAAEPGEALYLRKHRVRSGRQTINVTVPRKPTRAGVDPLQRLLQRTPGDNLADVEEAAGTGAAGVRR